MNNQPLNQPHSNRETPDPVRDESIRQNERSKVNNETAWGTLIGIGVAVLLSLGIASIVWPGLFKADDSKAPTVGPGQAESNTPKTQAPGRDTVIIERNRTQVVPVPVQVPEPKPNVNATVPPAAPQSAPNVNVTVPPAAPQSAPTKDEVLPETNSSPTSEPSPPGSGDTEN
jgi:hypothetical protein